MAVFNSQSLDYNHGYAHTFSKAGQYTWGVILNQGTYTINVTTPARPQPKDHQVLMIYSGGAYALKDGSQATLPIKVNDTVSWAVDTNESYNYWILGDNGKTGPNKDTFTSQLLGKDDHFWHRIT